ncbi:MAG: NTP transferase domain-containing protein [Anaerolineae bacterium]|nr:NTP transferase domain-containing protein [Anaerolineae bacterium]
MKAVILAGGKGRRLAPYTTVFPKPLVPLGTRPILDIIVRQLAYYGFDDIVLTVGYLAELIQAYFQTANDGLPDVKLTYVKEREPLGTAGSLALVDGLDDTFLVMNGDVLTSLNYAAMVDFHKAHGNTLTIGIMHKHIPIELGVIDLDEGGHVTDYREKPELVYPVSIGIYVYEPSVLGYITPGEHLDFPELVARLLAKGERVMGYVCQDYWLDIGNPGDYQRAQEEFERLEHVFLPGEREA